MRTPWIADAEWGRVVLDEAQAIKNAGTQQARAVKELKATARFALTGTPITGRVVLEAITPGSAAESPATAMKTQASVSRM